MHSIFNYSEQLVVWFDCSWFAHFIVLAATTTIACCSKLLNGVTVWYQLIQVVLDCSNSSYSSNSSSSHYLFNLLIFEQWQKWDKMACEEDCISDDDDNDTRLTAIFNDNSGKLVPECLYSGFS